METVLLWRRNQKVIQLLQWQTEMSATEAKHWWFHSIIHQEIVNYFLILIMCSKQSSVFMETAVDARTALVNHFHVLLMINFIRLFFYVSVMPFQSCLLWISTAYK